MAPLSWSYVAAQATQRNVAPKREVVRAGLDSLGPDLSFTSKLDLTLTYADDNHTDYGGNGYRGHGEGCNKQCANTNPTRAGRGLIKKPTHWALNVRRTRTIPPSGVSGHPNWFDVTCTEQACGCDLASVG